LKQNANIFIDTGRHINDNAKRDAKVLVVGNPCNTMCLILSHYVRDIPKENFTAMTRLDHNRALYQISNKVGCHISEIENLAIFGNHSPTMVPYVAQVKVRGVKANLDQQWVS
jgi:malate/lactate dehydrogenase